ncbi:MAG TPA: hypothetical protein QGF02_03730 [Candidatus Babeliales bacterium]|nr:hypothetical protein [Candidatus Babeliales bacterium]
MYTMRHLSLFALILSVIIASPLRAAFFSAEDHNKGISVRVQELSPKQAQKKLNNSFSRRHHQESTIPLEVTVTNNSNKSVDFLQKDIRLQLKLLEEFKQEQKSKRTFGLIGMTLLSIVALPVLSFVAMIGVELLGGALLATMMFIGTNGVSLQAIALSSLLVIPVLLCIAGVVGIVWSLDALWNQAFNEDGKLDSYAVNDLLFIEPKTTRMTTVFVKKKNMRKAFAALVRDSKTKKTIPLWLEEQQQ